MSIIKNVKALLGDNFAKGDCFESYVCRLFPESHFTLVQATTTRDDLNGRRIEQSLQPDFQFRHEPSRHRFWVECKFRSQLYDNKIQWAEKWQLDRYKEFQEMKRPEKIYVVIGFGGLAIKPYSLYCIPLDDIKYPGLFPNAIEQYRRSLNRDFLYLDGRLM